VGEKKKKEREGKKEKKKKGDRVRGTTFAGSGFRNFFHSRKKKGGGGGGRKKVQWIRQGSWVPAPPGPVIEKGKGERGEKRRKGREKPNSVQMRKKNFPRKVLC